MIITLLIASFLFSVVVGYKIVTHKTPTEEHHKVHREPLFYKNGEFLNTHQMTLQTSDANKDVCKCGNDRDIGDAYDERGIKYCQHCGYDKLI